MSTALLTLCVSLISSSHAIYYDINDFPPCISHADCVAHPNECWIEFAHCKAENDCIEEITGQTAKDLCSAYGRGVSKRGRYTDCHKLTSRWNWVRFQERQKKLVPDGYHVICVPLKNFGSSGIHHIDAAGAKAGNAGEGHNCDPKKDATGHISLTCITDTMAPNDIPAGGLSAVCTGYGRPFKAAYVSADAGSAAGCGIAIRCDSKPPGGTNLGAGEAYNNYLDLYDMDNGQQDMTPHYNGYYGGYEVGQQSQFVMSALLIICFVLCCLLCLFSNVCIAGGCYFVGRKVLEAEANKNNQNV